MTEKVITRRDFLRESVAGTLAVTMGWPFDVKAEAAVKQKTRVVLIRDAEVIDRKGNLNPKVIQRMLDKAVSTLFGTEDHIEAWKLLVKPNDIVGIKSNVWGPLPTPKEIEGALKKRIKDVGINERNIGIDDRGVLKNRIFLESTALINVRPLRTHHWSGIGGCIKNYIMFASWPPHYHPDSCANLGALWELPIVKDKTRLNILVLITPLFHGIGPHHFDLTYTWPYRGILVGTDPVALDAVGLKILELKRLSYFGESIPLKPPAKHVAIADIKYKIGTSDLKEIELLKLGFKEEILI